MDVRRGGEHRDEAAGYQAQATALGCDAVQKLVLRPRAGWIGIEPYGDPSYELRTNLNADGWFTVDSGNLSARARLVSYGANSASVFLDYVRVGGISRCTQGTYMLQPE